MNDLAGKLQLRIEEVGDADNEMAIETRTLLSTFLYDEMGF